MAEDDNDTLAATALRREALTLNAFSKLRTADVSTFQRLAAVAVALTEAGHDSEGCSAGDHALVLGRRLQVSDHELAHVLLHLGVVKWRLSGSPRSKSYFSRGALKLLSSSDALSLLTESVRIFDALCSGSGAPHEHRDLGAALVSLGHTLEAESALGVYRIALPYLYRARDRLDPSAPLLVSSVSRDIGVAYAELNELYRAKRRLRLAADLASSLDQDRYTIRSRLHSLQELVRAARADADLATARSSIIEAIELASQLPRSADSLSVCSALHHELGLVLQVSERYEEAIPAMEAARQYATELRTVVSTTAGVHRFVYSTIGLGNCLIAAAGARLGTSLEYENRAHACFLEAITTLKALPQMEISDQDRLEWVLCSKMVAMLDERKNK